MRCQQCQFENIPGQDRCLRCGAVLNATTAEVIVTPPRMAPWKRPAREALRWMRLRGISAERRNIRFPKMPISFEALIGLLLSVIPGLGHLAGGRFREVRWFVLGWLLCLLVGVFFYGGPIGLIFLGIAVSVHGWIAFNHSLIKKNGDFAQKLTTYGILLAILALLYWGVRNAAFGDFVFTPTNIAIPYQKVEAGDLLMARQSGATVEVLHRGALVVGEFHEQVGGYGHARRQDFEMVGQVIGLPGEKVEISGGRFVVDGKELDVKKYPVPQWLVRTPTSAEVQPGSYFVAADYRYYGYGMRPTPAMARNACILKNSDVKAVAVMRWLPLTRRGFLRTDQ